MDHPIQLNTTPAPPTTHSPRASRLRPLLTVLLLGLIVLLGAYFRTLNIRDWDNGTQHHPDERYMHYTVVNLSVPDDWRTYFISTCAEPVPSPRNPQSEPKDWEPSEQSGCSTLNPRNFVSWSAGYVYGTLPTTLTRLVVELTDRTDIYQVLLTGRWLSTLADLVTLLATFFLGRTLYGRRVGLLAAALYAGAVMPIQQSHFFTVDNFAVCFGTLALLFATRLARSSGGGRRWLDATLTGLFIAAAVASKINMAALVGLVFVAITQIAWRDWHGSSAALPASLSTSTVLRRMTRYALLLGFTGLITFVAFRVFQPDAFAGPNIWNIALEQRFFKLLTQARETADGTIDLPSSLQWAARTPWLFPWQNMVRWGMGLPLGLVAWLAWAVAGWQLIVRRRSEHLLPWLWIALYFGWQGQQFVTTMRYFLPLYSPLIVFAAWGLVRLLDAARDRLRQTQSVSGDSWAGRVVAPMLARLRQPRLAGGLLVLVLLATWSWAWAYTRIYTRTYTRVAAANWLTSVAPNGATTTWEWWDDLLPLPGGDQYRQLVTYPYGEEEREKYIGKTGLPLDVNGDPDGLIATLEQADYVVLASPRVYGAVERVPQRYPATLRYYQALFDGSLGFELAAEFHSSPSLFGIPISDVSAEEAFWVYDHPPVVIFRRTEAFSAGQARYLLAENVAWDEIYRGLRPVQINDAPTALQLTTNAWNKLQSSAAGYLFSGPSSPLLALLLWLLAIEALGLAAAALLWRLRLPLADRGLSLSRIIGLLIFAIVPALLGATQLLAISRALLAGWFVLLVLGGGWLLWRDRQALWAFVRAQRVLLGAAQALYVALLAIGLVLISRTAQPPAELAARWTALVRTPTLPPYDPLFAGGHDPLGYTAALPFALLDKLLGVLPSTALRLAIPTLLALLVLAVWSAIYNYVTAGRQPTKIVKQRPLTLPDVEPELLPVDVESSDQPVIVHEATESSDQPVIVHEAEAESLDQPVIVHEATESSDQPVIVHEADVQPQPSRLRYASLIYAALGALLVLLPGLPFGMNVPLSLWGALIGYRLDPLALALLVATTLALGSGLRHASALSTRTVTVLGALLALPLLFVSGQGGWPFFATSLALAGIAWAGLRGSVRRWASLMLPLVIVVLLVSRLFSWSIADPAPQFVDETLRPLALLLGWLLPLALLAIYSVLIGPEMVERGLGMVVGAVVILWIVLASGLGWSLAVVAVPLLMACAWLGVQAWLPGWGPRRWRAGALLLTAAAGLLLVMVAGLRLDGRLAGEVDQVLAVAGVLLAVAAGWTLPLLGWVGRGLLRRSTSGGLRWLRPVALIGVALWLVIVGGSFTRAAIATATPPTPLPPALADASAWINQQAVGTPLLVLAPQPESASVVSATGLPTLLTDANAQRRLRNILDPSINAVVDGRQRVISDLYGGDTTRVRELLQAYQVGYIVVGPYEQTQFGPQAGTALEALAQRNLLKLGYDRDGVRVYEAATNPVATPPYVAQRVTLKPPTPSTLMLDRPVAGLPVVDEYGWNRLATTMQPLGIGLWLLLLEGLGLLAWPLTSAVFGRWHDRGWGVSKLVGLIVWGYAVWLPVNLRWWVFNWWALVFGALVLALLSATALYRRQRPVDGSAVPSRLPPLGALLRSESCFLLAFGIWTLVRAANPDLWDPYFGGEKPFEFGFLNAIVRSSVLPPFDPFFSGGIVNYYYYGLYLMALPIRATGIDPALGFNLALATLLALTATAALALGRELTGRWRYGLLALLLMVGIGPVASAVQVNEARGLGVVRDALRAGLSGFSERLGFWFWGPSRVIPFTINEFPLFGFLFGDLHPHLIALPITLLAMACALELARRAPLRVATLALSALVIGALAIANSWDAPTYALLLGGALVGRAWRSGQARLTLASLGRVGLAIVTALGTVAVGLLLYAPFFMHYRAQVGGIGRVHATDSLLQYGLIYGPLLFLGISLLGSVALIAISQMAARRRTVVRAGTIALPLLIAGLMLTGARLMAPDPSQSVGWSLRLVLGLLALSGMVLALLPASTRRLRDREWLPLWLITVGLLVGFGIQFVLVRDHLADSPSERMNTVFKFGLQIWALLAIGGAAAVPIILRVLRRNEIVSGVWIGLLLVLIAPGLIYPLVGIPSRLGTRFDRTLPLTLDGLAFMPRAAYGYENQQIALRADGEAIDWLKQNIAGTPVFLTSDREFYRTYGMRIAANTGLPTVLGRLHQDEQRPGVEVVERADDVQTLYDTPDIATTMQLLAKYGVQYIYVGPIERAAYAPAGVAKFAQMQGGQLDLVYQNEGVQIYRVKPEVGAAVVPNTPLPAQPAAPDPVAVALAEQLAANPDDGGAAFGLARRYIELNRPAEAAQVLEVAAERHPNDVPLLHLLGDVQAQIGNADAAIDAWQRAIEAQPTGLNINKLGQGLLQLERLEEAEATFNRALSSDPNFPDPHFFLGELYRTRNGSGDRELAIAAYRRYLELAPADGPWRASAEAQLGALE